MDGGDDFSLTDNLDKMNSQDASKETDKAPQRVQPPINCNSAETASGNYRE